MSWSVRFSKKAQKQFKKLSPNEQKQIKSGIRRFTEDETFGDVKKIKTSNPTIWRLRLGDWRVFFDKDKEKLRINVTEIRRRTSKTY